MGRAFVTFSLLPDLAREGERVSWQRQGQGQRPKRPPCVAVFSPNLDLTNSYQALWQCGLWLKVYIVHCTSMCVTWSSMFCLDSETLPLSRTKSVSKECSRMPEFRVSWGHSRNWLSQVIERVVRIRQRLRRMISESRSTRPPLPGRLCNLIIRLKATLSELTEQTNAFLQSLFLCRKLSPAYIRLGQSHKSIWSATKSV